MKKHAPIVVNLQNPREKYWGIMLSIDGAGVNVRGIDLNSFEDWIREVAKGEGTMGLSTVFFPITAWNGSASTKTSGESSLKQRFSSLGWAPTFGHTLAYPSQKKNPNKGP